MKNALTLIIAIVISQSAGLVGAVFTSPAIPGWYAEINKPTLNPPSWIFGPVWITLYTLMGISAFLQGKRGNGLAWRGCSVVCGCCIAVSLLGTFQ